MNLYYVITFPAVEKATVYGPFLESTAHVEAQKIANKTGYETKITEYKKTYLPDQKQTILDDFNG